MTTFDVFLSHNSSDKMLVKSLGEALKQTGLSVWLDVWEIPPGRPWQEEIEKGLLNSKAIVVLVGPNGFGKWEMPEMRVALTQALNRQTPVIPVILPNGPKYASLPPFLQAYAGVTMASGVTPDAVDALYWGITGRKRS